MSELNKLDGGKKRVKKGRKQRGGAPGDCYSDSDCGGDKCDKSKGEYNGECIDPQAGGARTKKYNGRDYVVRTGSRGGKYITVKGRKVYV
jgi:hypothetical protein